MEEKSKIKSWRERITNRYRLIVMNESSLEEVAVVNLSRLNIYILFSTTVFLLTFAIAALIIFTPIKEYLPGYEGVRLKKEVIVLKANVDSLNVAFNQRNQYFNSLRFALTGGRDSSFFDNKITELNVDSIDLEEISALDYDLRHKVENDMRYNIYSEDKSTDLKHFIEPLVGLVSNKFDKDLNHLGVDIVAEEKSVIKAAYDGVIIMSAYTLDNGYVIGIQHSNDYISFYKHNSQLLKKSGNFVKAGDPIAIIGSSGENTTGTHLHFEIWNKGEPEDPQLYFDFK